MDAEQDLKATIQDVAGDAEELQAIEHKKGQLDPSDPRVLTLSRQAEAIARDLPLKAAAETSLAKETTGAA
jgi:hypothetical protein